LLRLAIGRVCQSHAAVSTILTEQTEFTARVRAHKAAFEQIPEGRTAIIVKCSG
jgi:hypothetical protein